MTEVVILPGLDGTARLLDIFCARLAASGVQARAIAYPSNRVLDYPELEAFVRSKLPSGPFVLLGESFSGPIAIRIATCPPAGLLGLVLSTAFARAPFRALVPLAPVVRFVPARLPIPLFSWWLLGRWASPALKAALAAALRSVSDSVLRARAFAALRVDVSTLASAIQLPTLQLVATHDRLLAASVSRELAANLPHCRTVRIAGPHLLLQAAAKPCAQEVADFTLGLGFDNSSKPTPLHGVDYLKRQAP